jgi:predicted  nucleic acid-binding Zn-ribbon protein
MGEDLKFIDFHQLQIENKKHIKDIDDRNSKLQVLKDSASNTVNSLNRLKQDLETVSLKQKEIESELQNKAQSKIK